MSALSLGHARLASYQQKLDLALQLTSALMHISPSEMSFYPDLKPDNLLLLSSGESLGVKLIDFEQRGGWSLWSPPEVY